MADMDEVRTNVFTVPVAAAASRICDVPTSKEHVCDSDVWPCKKTSWCEKYELAGISSHN